MFGSGEMRGRVGRGGVEYPGGLSEVPAELSTNEMCRRLKLLTARLAEMEPDETGARDRWKGLAEHLASEVFRAHQSREVRILAACSVADLLRMCAHEGSPYADGIPNQTKDVCLFLIRQLRGLDAPNDPLYPRFYYLLENLTKVRSLLIGIELEDATDGQEVLTQLIRHTLAALSDDHEGREEELVTELLSSSIAAADHISWPALDALLMHLIQPSKASHPRAAAVSANVVKRAAAELEEPIQAFITQTFAMGRIEEVDLGKHVLALIAELHPVVPDVFLPIIPQLECRL